jgi:type I restriction-modification system DNA methylase subunit
VLTREDVGILKRISRAKAHGVHYTPPELAEFLADVLWKHLEPPDGKLKVLDPACGDGALLSAFVEATPIALRRRLSLVGYETDPLALATAGQALSGLGTADVALNPVDFLALPSIGPEL